ncbi:hypothetical protein GYMLUDRAFT_38652 [Collybiopsis luxurians FD-317 M1]|nr:hypothetical protein GYMLUDRAFT_38652 [Collybiopsis luxurians FD-317 M1]
MMPQLNAEDVQTQMNWVHYVGLMQFVVLVYDWLLTLDQEVELIWRRPFKTKLPVLLFFFNRYLTLLGNIPIFVLYFWSKPVNPHNPQLGARNLDFYLQSFIFVVQSNITALFILRVMALYGRRRWITLFLIALGLGMTCNSIVQIALANRQPYADKALSDQIGNIPIFSSSQGFHLAYVLVGTLIFDICIFSLTVWATIDMFRSKFIQGGVGAVIMRDGLMYFGIITLVTLGNLLAYVFGTNLLKALLAIPSNILSSILMSHMMLDLREDRNTKNYATPTQVSSILFS